MKELLPQFQEEEVDTKFVFREIKRLLLNLILRLVESLKFLQITLAKFTTQMFYLKIQVETVHCSHYQPAVMGASLAQILTI